MASKRPFDTVDGGAYCSGINKPAAKNIAKSRGKNPPLAISIGGPKSRVKPRLAPSRGLGVETDAAVVRAKTLRLIPEFEVGLGILKDVLRKPINKMVNEAVREYIEKRHAEVEAELRGALEKLKAYKRPDPKFASARAKFVDGEARHGTDDALEGVVFDVERTQRNSGKARKGPSQTMVREILRG